MKKYRNIILTFVLSLLFLLTGCTNDTIPNENSVKLYLSDNFTEYIDYKEVPSFTFEFDGTLNTIKNVNKTYYTVFSNNEDIILSNALTSLFTKYKDSTIFEVTGSDKIKSRYFSTLENGKVKNITMTVDDEVVYDEVAYVKLDNGLTLTIDYCRFVSEGVTYYTWRYTQSIAFYLYYPLMRINNGDKKEIVLLTLPNMISLHVGPELKIASLIGKDAYLKDSYYTFSYYEKEDESFDKKAFVTDYYSNYNLESISENTYSFIYLNNKFRLILNETNFIIQWMERI